MTFLNLISIASSLSLAGGITMAAEQLLDRYGCTPEARSAQQMPDLLAADDDSSSPDEDERRPDQP